MKYLILPFLLLMSMAVHAQTTTVNLKKHFKKVSKNQYAPLNQAQLKSLSNDPKVFQDLGVFIRSEKLAVKKEAVRLIRKLGPKHASDRDRKMAVHLLLEACKSGESVVLSSAAKGLQQFRSGDFDELARDLLIERIQSKPAHIDQFFLTAGFLGLQQELDAFRPEYRQRNAARRALNLALTRCGNEQKSESMMKNIREIPVNDEFVYEIVPMLVYTRQRAQINFLLDLILSDKRSCQPAGEDVHGHILCGYRVIEQIAPVIEGFPVRVNETTGDLVVNDYKQAMSEVRDWIQTHRDSYVLKQDVF